MRKVGPSGRWVRAIAVLVTALTLHTTSAAHADDVEFQGLAEQTSGHVLPLPPRGAHRLIRIGPQALVQEDDRGRFTMVDEPPEPPKVGRGLVAATALLGLIGTDAFLTFGGEYGLTFDVGRSARPQ
jgi:hypothetical protein